MKMKFLRFAFDTKLTNGLPFITMWEGNLAGMSFLVDSGSTDCVVYQRTVQECPDMFTPLEEKGAMYGMGGVEYETTYVGVKVTFCGCEKLKKFQMVDNATSDKWYEQTGIRMHGILGVDFFRANNMLLDFVNERVIVAPDEFRRAEAS